MRKFATLASIALLVGCGAAVGNNLVKYTNGETPASPTEAPTDGMYGLYGTYDANPVITYRLSEGDKLGFEKRDDKVFAVAGTNEKELQTKWGKAFYWRQEKVK